MDRTLDWVWRALQAAAVLLVLAFFLRALQGLLNPFVLFWVLVAVLLPFRGLPGHGALVTLSAVLASLWLLATTGFLLAPFVLAMVLAYVLDPLVDRLEARGLRRSPAILLLAVPAVVAVVLLVVVGIPAAAAQLADVIRDVPVLLARVGGWVEAARARLLTLRLPFLDQGMVDRLRNVDSTAVVSFLEQRKEEIAARLWQGALGVGRGLGFVLSVLGYVVLTPVLTFYLLRDWKAITAQLAGLVPGAHRANVLGLAHEYDRLLSLYLRGQITVALTVGAITAVGLAVLRFPYALLLGAIVAVFNLVPYLGLILSLVPAIVIALVSGSVLVSLGKVALVYGLAQGLEGAVISPKIVGSSVGLHPVWVVLALAVGGFFFGFVGLLIAVPGAVGIKLLVLRGTERYRTSSFYREGTPRGVGGELPPA